jgi:ABC-type uncharacterized transport system involved in gliding motility auxiliary subunit
MTSLATLRSPGWPPPDERMTAAMHDELPLNEASHLTEGAVSDVYLLDTNVFDWLVSDDALLAAVERVQAAGLLRFETTHVQEDELGGIPPGAAKAIRIDRIRRQVVPTGAFVLGFSKLGMAALGDGKVLEHVRGAAAERSKHTQDGLIAETARARGRILVTDDGRLRKRAQEMQIEVWSGADLQARVERIASTV